MLNLAQMHNCQIEHFACVKFTVSVLLSVVVVSYHLVVGIIVVSRVLSFHTSIAEPIRIKPGV